MMPTPTPQNASQGHMFIREDPTFYKLDHSELIE